MKRDYTLFRDIFGKMNKFSTKTILPELLTNRLRNNSLRQSDTTVYMCGKTEDYGNLLANVVVPHAR